MPKLIKFFSIPVLLTLFVSSPVEARTFKIATLAPEGTTWMNKIREGAQSIENKTNGRVKFKFYTGGVMGGGNTILKKMRIGQLHGGALTSGELAEVYNNTNIYTLPFLFRNYKEVDHVRSKMDKLLVQGLAGKGIIVLGIAEGGFAYIMSQSPVYTIKDMETMKSWLPEGDIISQSMYEVANISPVSLSLGDVYTGLQTGLIDTIATTPTAAIAFQWHTKIQYVTNIPLVYVTGMVVMDKKAFDKIKPTDQKIVLAEMKKVFAQLDKLNRIDNENAFNALKNQGVKAVELSKDEKIRWDKIAEESISKLENQGAFTQQMYIKLQEYLQDIRK